jgi:ankyrin repeat protein
LEEVKKIVAQFPGSINIEDTKGFTPLILAVYNNHPHVVEHLLGNGAMLEAGDTAGNTALMGVCFKGYKDLAKMLIDAGVEVDDETLRELRR